MGGAVLLGGGAALPGCGTSGTTGLTRAGLTVGADGSVPDADLRRVADAAARGARTVRSLWGDGALWSSGSRARIEVVATPARFEALGGGAGDQVAATTRSDHTVLIDRSALAALTDAGLQAVLAHELTHARLGTPVGPPRWIVEGPAEYTGWSGSGLSLAAYAPSLRARVRTGRSPSGPPDDTGFTATDSADVFRAAYQDALAWCAFLAHRHGAAVFVRTVEDALRAGDSAATVLRRAYGPDPAAASAYRTWLAATLATSTASAPH